MSSDGVDPDPEPGDAAVRSGGDDLTWLRTVDDVLDAAADREEELECRLEDLTVEIPVRMGEDAERAVWGADGTVRVRFEGASGPLADWLRWWYDAAER
jgi:hypothetical protein